MTRRFSTSAFTPVDRGGYIERLPILDPNDPAAAPPWVRARYGGRRCVIAYDNPSDLQLCDLVAGGPAPPPHHHPPDPAPPIVRFTVTVYDGRMVITDGRDSTAGEASTLVDYAWSWGDGTLEHGPQPRAAHMYSQAGDYLVGLTVTDAAGRTDTATVLVPVDEQ